ncbi:hypothetical protein TSOC_005319 [Tetrabaena socialis]|uniref:Uncharacterized protein n=1 Tax=Tetrabaena socialis TaxID=47790 RepID=A0A2J8A6P1_9CHLO|nr:hypothetical protein TSOC_005319 [Tetrabaena socialis]|eukprot:PNH08153.1 hypothetical protein TSOC_005319 [Tetrabaena socialis]
MASATAAAAEAIGLGPAHDEASYVSPHARNKITYKLMHMGEGRCNTLIDDYNMCIKGKTLGQLLCKGQYQASQDCMHR